MSFYSPVLTRDRAARQRATESNIYFDYGDLNPNTPRHVPRHQQRNNNADFAAKMASGNYRTSNSVNRPAEWGIDNPSAKRRRGDPANYQTNVRGEACHLTGPNEEYRDELPTSDLRWEDLNDDFVGEARSKMDVIRPRTRPLPEIEDAEARAEERAMLSSGGSNENSRPRSYSTGSSIRSGHGPNAPRLGRRAAAQNQLQSHIVFGEEIPVNESTAGVLPTDYLTLRGNGNGNGGWGDSCRSASSGLPPLGSAGGNGKGGELPPRHIVRRAGTGGHAGPGADSSSFRVLHTNLQELPSPYRPSRRVGIEPKGEFDKVVVTTPERVFQQRELFNRRR